MSRSHEYPSPARDVTARDDVEPPLRILLVFASAVLGSGEIQLSELAQKLDRRRYEIDLVVCFHELGTFDQTLRLEASGVPVDRTPYHLSLEQTVAYLASLIPAYHIVMSCGNVADVYPALELLHTRPPLIEYGALASEALAGPKHLTARYVGACQSTRDAAAMKMPGKEGDAIVVPSMLDMDTALSQWQRLFDSVAPAQSAPTPTLFKSFLQGGFECSSHRRAHDRRRLDVIAATGHDVQAAADYACLADFGMVTVRDGLRWHLIEQRPGTYDWASLDHQLAAAREVGTEVIWDLMHYGWPDDIDIWSPQFPDRFAAFAAAAADYIAPRSSGRRFYAPINEISFLSWGGGDVGYLNPFGHGRGFELKVQLVRASVAAMKAIRRADPAARFVHPEPLINIVTHGERPEEAGAAEGHRQAQFQAWDMIAGRAWPLLGGEAGLLDIIGVNYYSNNQWVHGGPPLSRGDPDYRPFRHMLAEVYARYGRPLFVAETGIEGDDRASWFAYICDDVNEARRRGVPVEGICLYPILDHPGWDDDRHCPNGLIGLDRKVHTPLADLIRSFERHQL